MRLSFPHQSDDNSELFGMLARRAVFANRPAPRKAHDAVSIAELAKEKIEVNEEKIATAINAYNKRMASTPKNQAEWHNHGAIDVNWANMDAMEAQIKKAIGAVVAHVEENTIDELDENKQYLSLINILSAVKKMREVSGEVPADIEHAHRERLHHRFGLLDEARERKIMWQKKPAYKALEAAFESVAEESEYAHFWKSSEGFSGQKVRESRELFFSILAEQTAGPERIGFETEFVLGPDFGNDPVANRENFPFIYSEWLKIEGAAVTGSNVSPEQIDKARSRALNARDVIGSGISLGGIAAELEAIIKRNPGAQVDVNMLRKIDPIPEGDAWQQKAEAIEGFIRIMSDAARKNPDLPQAPGWKAASENLIKFQKHAEAEYDYHRLLTREADVAQNFTREVLSQPKYRDNVMKIVMKKFMRAVDMVDRPMGHESQQGLLHPNVRRMLIASVYDHGVASFRVDENGKEILEDDIRSDHVWMISTLTLSDYFNANRLDEYLDKDHDAVLKAAFFGSKMIRALEHTAETERFLNAYIKVLKERGATTDEAERRKILEQMAAFPPARIPRIAKLDADQALQRLTLLGDYRQALEEFLKKTQAAVQDPTSKQSQEFIAQMKAGNYADLLGTKVRDAGLQDVLSQFDIMSPAALEAYQRQVFDLQIYFQTEELQDKNDLMFFEGLGMNIEGFHGAYLEYIDKNPEMQVENWDRLLLSRDEATFNKFMKFMDTIIPESVEGGKADFMAGLRSLRAEFDTEGSLQRVLADPSKAGENQAIISVYTMLKVHLRHREEVAAASDRGQKEIATKLKGMHIGDKISKYAEGVWDMMVGPGQSWANRLAGGVLIIGFLKMARKAYKGEGKSGKALRALFVAGAVEIATKEITGRGWLDRAGLDAIAGAMEGTYEAVLLQKGREKMEEHEITDEEHAAALHELNDVPFHELVEWYKSTDENGVPREGKPDKFPSQIQASRIARGTTWKERDKKLHARFVVKKTVEHFITYVGGQKDTRRGHDHALLALEERYIRQIKDPKYKAQAAEHWLPDRVASMFRGNQDKLTWQFVMRSEIDPREVDLTHGQTWAGKIETAAAESWEEIKIWTEEQLGNKAAGHMREFWTNAGEATEDVKDFLVDVKDYVGDKIYFGKKSVEFWYGAHKYEIYQVAKDHWNLAVTGISLPFKAVYAVDQWAVPWTLTKVRQIEEILRPHKATTLDGPLSAEHIVQDAGTRADMLANPQIEGSSNPKINPEFTFFGLYQNEFLQAFSAKTAPNESMAYTDAASNVGYYISEMEVTPGTDIDAIIAQDNEGAMHNQLYKKSWEEARQHFRDANLPWDSIKNFLYPIHTFVHSTGQPPKMYVFWRMPLPGSAELYLKEAGRWPDYTDPRKIKERDPWNYDPTKGSLENIRSAFAVDMGPLRVLVGKGGAALSQLPRFALWNAEKAGDIVSFFATIGKTGQEKRDIEAAIERATTIEPASEQLLDEFSTAAGNRSLAMSEFYKNPDNAKLYEFSLQFAQQERNSSKLFLGLLKDRPGYEGSFYLDNPGPNVYLEMAEFYVDHWVGENGPNQAIIDQLRKGARGQLDGL